MYQVNFYFNARLINTFEFGTLQKAFFCFMSHTDEKGLTISETNEYHSLSYGNVPQEEIEITYNNLPL